ncbi:large-conductance mechanosensitive channel [Gorgonomyces haynaldii]|nr:large-conductance mechanosensitive channel [Gorgonomyces haynaldii]
MSSDTVNVVVDKQNAAQRMGQGIKKGALNSVKAVGSVVDDFKEFLNRGNVVDLAVGVVMGTAFGSVVTSFTNDLITPIIALASPASSFDNMYVPLRCPKNLTSCGPSVLPTVKQANDAGVVTWNYGKFIQTIISFLIISIIIFFIVKLYAALFRRKKPETPKRECPYCTKDIPLKATRCPECTSDLPAASMSEAKLE